MEGFLVLGFLAGALATLGSLALRFGADSRDGSSGPHVPEAEIAV